MYSILVVSSLLLLPSTYNCQPSSFDTTRYVFLPHVCKLPFSVHLYTDFTNCSGTIIHERQLQLIYSLEYHTYSCIPLTMSNISLLEVFSFFFNLHFDTPFLWALNGLYEKVWVYTKTSRTTEERSRIEVIDIGAISNLLSCQCRPAQG